MRIRLQAVLLLANVAAFASGCGFSSAMILPGCCQAARAPELDATTSDNLRDDEQAVAALTRLNVPLQRDALGRVRWLEAVKGELSDEAIRRLQGLPMLEWLEIGGGSVTAAGMTHLKDCRALRRLYVHDVKISDDALAGLAGLRRLESLSLQDTGITGKALKHLNPGGTLKVLNLSGDEIKDEDMDQIARFSGLEVLALQNTKVTGAGLARLKGMSKLNVLNLGNCSIADGDLEHFTSMQNLRIVYASGCNLGEQAIKELGDKVPMLSIFP